MMKHHFYLKRVRAYVRQEEYRLPFAALAGELADNGILFEWADHAGCVCEAGDGGTGAENAGCVCAAGNGGTGKEGAGCVCAAGDGGTGAGGAGGLTADNVCGMDGALWITDDASFARALAEAGLPFAAYLHEGSREQDFSVAGFGIENPGETDACFLDRVYRRFAGLPWDILETERCLVRETTEADVDAFYRIYSDPAVTRYTEGLYPEPEQEREYVREYREKIYSFYGFGVWTVLLRESGEVIGRAGFTYRPGYRDPELGFVIGVPWQRRGLAGEVCGAILRYGREELGFTGEQALVEPENEVSLALLCRLGFEIRESVEEDGKQYLLLVREGA